MEAMKSDVDEIALQGIEFWSTVCDEEVDLAIELSEVCKPQYIFMSQDFKSLLPKPVFLRIKSNTMLISVIMKFEILGMGI
jgi:hypothetical protein